MRIMILGENSPLGWNTARVFKKDHEIKTIDPTEINLYDPILIQREIVGFSPDVVVNCIEYNDVDECETEGKKEDVWKLNAGLPGHLASICSEARVLLVHISSSYVFDGKKELPLFYSEDDEPFPLSVYGKSKLEGEKRIIANNGRYIIVRTAWLYGIKGRNFLTTILNMAIKNPEKEIKVINDQFGSPTWSLRLALQIERLLKEKALGLFHATSRGYCSWFELASYFLKKMEIKHRLVPCTAAEYFFSAVRPANAVLENSRLMMADMNLMTGWRHGLDQFVSRYRQELLDQRKNYV